MTDEKRRKQLRWQLPFLLFLIAGTFFIVRQQQNTPFQKNQGFVFGTIYHVTYQHSANLQADIEAALAEVDSTFSMFNEKSLVSKLNREGIVATTPMLLEVFHLATAVSRETDGAFDITVGPLVNAWGFGFKHEEMPTEQQVDSLRRLVGMHNVELRANNSLLAKKDPRMVLDFSAIAKGYGAEMVARRLRHKGVENFMIEIGGEIVAQGISPNRVPWRIGVTKPTEDSLLTGEELQTVLSVTDCAMATSGNYRNFYYKNGRRYAHTIDPRTGHPVQHSILSATVLADDCATADAYATSFMVLGMEQARNVLERHPELKVYFIYTDSNGQLAVWYSPALEGKMKN